LSRSSSENRRQRDGAGAGAGIHPAVIRRIVIAQSLYAAGAALCFLNTYYSIAAIILVQVNYAVAPRFCWGPLLAQGRKE
jgi:hypothetical protein